MSRAGGVLRLVPQLPRAVWILHGGLAASTFGSGLVVPFLVIYLHEVRGLSLAVAGAAVATQYAVALVAGLAAGRMVDSLGARAVAAAALVLIAAATALLPAVREPWEAFAVLSAAGVGGGAYWPGYAALLAALAPRERRHTAYAAQRVIGNVALGLGALAGGLLASLAEPRTFTVIFLLAAVSYLTFALVLAFVPPAHEPGGRTREPGGYRAVLRDRAFVLAIAVNAVLAAAGLALLNSMLPVFATSDVGVTTRVVGAIFLCNTLTIVLLQLPVTRLIEGRRRMPALAAVGAIWALAWSIALAAELPGYWAAAALLFLAAIVFAVGECVQGVVQGPLVADLAPSATRGRYMALWLTTAQAGIAAGPAIGALLLAVSPYVLWPAAAAACLVAGGAALLLEHVIPEHARRTPARAVGRVDDTFARTT